MGVSLTEQETTINYNRIDKTVSVWTSDRTVMTKMDKLVESSPYYTLEEVARDSEGELISKTYCIADKNLLSFRKMKMTLTEEQKEARRQQLLNRVDLLSSVRNFGEN